jgi:hypothetical protein
LHPAISQVQELSACIEEELSVAFVIFDKDHGLGGYTAMSIATLVAEKVIQKLASLLQLWDKELSGIIKSFPGDEEINEKPLYVLLDLLETMHETMPKGFMLLIKDKDLPLKKAVESIYFKSQ